MSAPCCISQHPDVKAEYTPNGQFGELDGLKASFAGPEPSDKALLVVYDVFGFSPQILLGAYMLAAAVYRVVRPDFLLGKYVDPHWFTESEEKRKDFLSGPPDKLASQSESTGAAIRALDAKGYKIGAVGLCWGWSGVATSTAVNELEVFATSQEGVLNSVELGRGRGKRFE